MKGDTTLIKTLNTLLADELTAISQYMVHSEMNANWGYTKLHEHFEKRAIDEMKHAEKLIGRILFLEGMPVVSKLNPIEDRARSGQAAFRRPRGGTRRDQGLQRRHRPGAQGGR